MTPCHRRVPVLSGRALRRPGRAVGAGSLSRIPRRIAAVVLAIALAGVGPVPGGAQVRLGVVGGISRASLGGEGGEASNFTRARSGLMAGGQVEVRLGPSLWIRPALVFVQKGGRQGFDDSQTVLQTDYLELPLLLGLSGNKQLVRPEVYAGPYLAARVGCAVRSTVAGATRSLECADSGVQKVRRTDVGLVLGAGFEARGLQRRSALRRGDGRRGGRGRPRAPSRAVNPGRLPPSVVKAPAGRSSPSDLLRGQSWRLLT